MLKGVASAWRVPNVCQKLPSSIFSGTVWEKIEAAGGSVEVLER